MSKTKNTTIKRASALLLLFFIACITGTVFARVGGAGGHGGGGHGYSGGGHGFSGGGGHYYGGGSGGGLSPVFIILIIIVVIIVIVYSKRGNVNDVEAAPLPPSQPFPDGLDPQKVGTSFMAIQDAWQRKDLTNVRKWLSDGMYQKLTTQFRMMNALGQQNTLNNIRIYGVSVADTRGDANYQTAEVAISFSMDDSFTSSKFPQFNESFQGDTDTEYWTFIKRKDSESEKNLYDNNNCPNCGAPFEVKMGEISRCSNCNTLTNNAAYDWVLSEITQDEAYTGGAGLAGDPALKELMKNDPFFSVQRMEDIASNVFMQVMDMLTGADKKQVARFADEATAEMLAQQKKNMAPFTFDRLFLESVTLGGYSVENDVVKMSFDIIATFRRVATTPRLQIIDNDFVTSRGAMELSRSKNAVHNAKTGETVYSHECSNCGAPYTDTTLDHCSYCDAPVVDIKRNWVLTAFYWE